MCLVAWAGTFGGVRLVRLGSVVLWLTQAAIGGIRVTVHVWGAEAGREEEERLKVGGSVEAKPSPFTAVAC